MTAKDFARDVLAELADPYGERRKAASDTAELRKLRTQLAEVRRLALDAVKTDRGIAGGEILTVVGWGPES